VKKKKRKLEISEYDIDPLNTDLLRKFLSGDGKAARIVPHYVHGLPSRMQRKVAKAIKRARQLNLI
jgi:small subunit ribosomal protein S18